MPVLAYAFAGRGTVMGVKLSCEDAGAPFSLIDDSIDVRCAGKSGVCSTTAEF